MKTFALIGYPLGHSMSQVIHKELFRLSNTDSSYDMIEVSPENLKDEFTNLKQYKGFNVTIPHKIDIINYLDDMSDRAKLFGAVNTVQITKEKIIGHNTDCFGFLRAIDMADITLGGNVLLCGSGGVSRMFAFEAVLANANLTIAVRKEDIDAANTIKDEIKEKLNKDIAITTLDKVGEGWDLIINGTPVGMYPKIDGCPLNENIIKSSKAVFDAVYNPQETKFISIAKNAGLKYSNGLPMLVWQAAVAQEIWNGVEFTIDDIKEVIKITQKELDKQ